MEELITIKEINHLTQEVMKRYNSKSNLEHDIKIINKEIRDSVISERHSSWKIYGVSISKDVFLCNIDYLAQFLRDQGFIVNNTEYNEEPLEIRWELGEIEK